MHEPQLLWERYVEPKYRDQVSKVAFMHGNFMVYWVQIPIRLDSRLKAGMTTADRRFWMHQQRAE
jgi:hypothetical protein